MFDRIVVVDWSASASPNAAPTRSGSPTRTPIELSLHNPTTRAEAFEYLAERDRRRGPVRNTDRVRLLARLSSRDRSCARSRRVRVAGHVGPPRIDGRRRRSEPQQPIRRRGGAQRHDGVASRSVLGLPTDRASRTVVSPPPDRPTRARRRAPAHGGRSRTRYARAASAGLIVATVRCGQRGRPDAGRDPDRGTAPATCAGASRDLAVHHWPATTTRSSRARRRSPRSGRR